MENNKQIRFDVTSTLAEKGVDAGVEAARNFLGKLIMPAVEEAGLLMKDKITAWRLNNQVKILNKAKTICEKHNINPKNISLKLVVPLLDGASLEEDEALQDKWANLLSNLADSEQSIENHVFPYILGQLSKNEFQAIEEYYDEYEKRREKFSYSIKELLQTKTKRTPEINKRLEELKNAIIERKAEINNQMIDDKLFQLTSEKELLQKEMASFDSSHEMLKSELKAPVAIPKDELKNFELSNLTRLGLIKEQVDYYANTKTVEPARKSLFYGVPEPQLNVKVDLDSDSWYWITEFGEMFVRACKEKMNKNKTTT